MPFSEFNPIGNLLQWKWTMPEEAAQFSVALAKYNSQISAGGECVSNAIETVTLVNYFRLQSRSIWERKYTWLCQ